jgi:hypothetical protein
MSGISIYRLAEGKALEGWNSIEVNPTEEEQRWFTEGGGVCYRKQVMWEGQANGYRALLDLGKVRGTAEVSVNGRVAGVRVLSPYVFDVTDFLSSGENELEVLGLGTLGPYLDTQSPTHYVFHGQRTTGLFGPLKLGRSVDDVSSY